MQGTHLKMYKHRSTASCRKTFLGLSFAFKVNINLVILFHWDKKTTAPIK
jgi:hypothetical protein